MTYLMYMPPGSGKIRVTLHLLTWSWSGTANLLSGQWVLATSPPPTYTVNPMGANSIMLPTWSNYVLNIPQEKETHIKLQSILSFAILPAMLAQMSDVPKVREWGEPSGSFQLSISPEGQEFHVGQPIPITAIVKNVTDHPALYKRKDVAVFYDMEIRLPMPKESIWKPTAALTEEGRRQRFPRMGGTKGGYLAPGTEVVDTIDIAQLYEMVIPGSYHISFSCRLPIAKAGDPEVVIRSNEIVVTVLPKE